MDKSMFSLFVMAFLAMLVWIVLEVRESIKEKPTIPNIFHAVASALVFVAAFVYYTASIKDGAVIAFRGMNGGGFSIGQLVGYGFVWLVMSVLNGVVLTVLLFLPLTIYLFAKYPNMTWRTKTPKELDADMWASMYAAGAAIGYDVLLYAFGLVEELEVFWILGI